MIAQDIIKIIKRGGVGILHTDTLYGIVGLALAPVTVERIYRLKKRSDGKPFIVLISSWQDLERINVEITPEQKKILKKVWPGPVSVVLPCDN
ncbi:MAG: Sua5/YciO/YrdC/YwlC family protein, partial [Candidatus Vogelbacteria bacterium]|nr:Sua5/YciO/YrdC/YwlC family protein [Candidatus Vogelbacteria bacterium]